MKLVKNKLYDDENILEGWKKHNRLGIQGSDLVYQPANMSQLGSGLHNHVVTTMSWLSKGEIYIYL